VIRRRQIGGSISTREEGSAKREIHSSWKKLPVNLGIRLETPFQSQSTPQSVNPANVPCQNFQPRRGKKNRPRVATGARALHPRRCGSDRSPRVVSPPRLARSTRATTSVGFDQVSYLSAVFSSSSHHCRSCSRGTRTDFSWQHSTVYYCARSSGNLINCMPSLPDRSCSFSFCSLQPARPCGAVPT
jgi:hypothetical protein